MRHDGWVPKKGEGSVVYGASDDLIDFEGDVYGEHGCYDHKRAIKVTMSDGTTLLVKYGKPTDGGVWWIRCTHPGLLFDRIDVKEHEDDGGYSDRAYFKPGLTWARIGGRNVK